MLRPKTLSQAAAQLFEEGPSARLVAGGTDLWPKMKRRQMEPATVIALRQLGELRQFSGTPRTGVTIGANLSLHELERHPVLLEAFPAVAEAARSISSPPLKTMGTLGGNLCVDTRCNYYDQTYEWRKSIQFCLKKEGDICWVAPGSPRCWAVSSTDLAPVMLALGAQIELVSKEGERRIQARELYNADGITYLTKAPHEILSRVFLPPANGDITVFKKLRRRGSIDFPLLNVAVWIRTDSRRRVCENARIAIGAVTSHPFLVDEVAEYLHGKELADDVIEEVAEKCWRASRPLDNTDLNFSWRHKMVRVWVRKALQEAAGMLN